MDSKKILAIVAIVISVLALSGVAFAIFGGQLGTFAILSDNNSVSGISPINQSATESVPAVRETTTQALRVDNKKSTISPLAKNSRIVSDAQDYFLELGPMTVLTLKAMKKGVADVTVTMQAVYVVRGQKAGKKLFLTGAFINSIEEGRAATDAIAETFGDPKTETQQVSSLRSQYDVDDFYKNLDKFINESAKNRQATVVSKQFRRFLVNPSFSTAQVEGLGPVARFLEALFGPKSYYSQS